MAEFETVFCEYCGASINADTSQQYIKCDSCGSIVSNPKYKKEEKSTTKDKSNTKTSGGGGFFAKIGEFLSSAVEEISEEINMSDDSCCDHHDNPFEDHRDYFFRRDPFEPEYYAVVEKGAFSYSGECPGIAFTSVSFCDTYEECITEIEKKLGDQIGPFNKKYDQPDPKTLNIDKDKRIVRVRPRR